MTREQFYNQLWLAARLEDHGLANFEGLISAEQRKELSREGCRKASQVVVGTKANGKPENYAEAFERVYGEPLEPIATVREAGRGYPNAQSAPAPEGSG